MQLQNYELSLKTLYWAIQNKSSTLLSKSIQDCIWCKRTMAHGKRFLLCIALVAVVGCAIRGSLARSLVSLVTVGFMVAISRICPWGRGCSTNQTQAQGLASKDVVRELRTLFGRSHPGAVGQLDDLFFFVATATIFLEGNDCVRVSHDTYLTGGLYSDGRMEACDLGSQSLRCFLWSVPFFEAFEAGWMGTAGISRFLHHKYSLFKMSHQSSCNDSMGEDSEEMQSKRWWSKPSGLRNEQKIDSTLIRPFQASLRRKVVSFLDACDAALDPVYLFFEAGLATWHQSNTGSFFFGNKGAASWKQEKASKASGRFHMSWDWKGQGDRIRNQSWKGSWVEDAGLKGRYGYGCCNHDENSV